MTMNITFRHLEPTEALKSHVRGRVEHLQRYLDRPTEAHAVLHVESLDHHAEITVKAGTFLLRGTARTPDMYASIDAAAERIERQLKKHKEKQHGASKANGVPHHNGAPAEAEAAEGGAEGDTSLEVVDTASEEAGAAEKRAH